MRVSKVRRRYLETTNAARGDRPSDPRRPIHAVSLTIYSLQDVVEFAQ